MKKFSRIIAFALAVIMVAGTFVNVSAATVDDIRIETDWDDAVNKLYAWGIINEVDVIASKDTEKKLERHIFALWTARVLTHEFGNDMAGKFDDDVADSADFETGYTDVDGYEGELFRRAIAYVTANELFEGYGNFEFGPKDPIELYQACKVVISLLSVWQDEKNSKYIDDVHAFDAEYGDGTQMSEGIAYMKISQDLGIVDSYYVDKCSEYFWDTDLTYGEAAYILVNAIEKVKPASCTDGCEHEDKDGDGQTDCFISESMTITPREESLTGFVKSPTDGEVLGADDTVVLSVLVSDEKYIDIEFTAAEFTKLAIDKDGVVDLTTGPEGYEYNTLVNIEYFGNLIVLRKAARNDLSAAELAEVKAGILGAYNEETDDATVVPVAGYTYYTTYLVNADGAQSVLPECVRVKYDAKTNKLAYGGVEYTVASASDEVEGNKIIARKNGVDLDPTDVAKYFRNLAQGEMSAVFYDIQKDGSAFEYVEFLSCTDFAPVFSGINNVEGADKAYSYILYNMAISVGKAEGKPFVVTGEDKNAGLKIVICNSAADGKVYPYYSYTSVYSEAGTDAAFKTVSGAVKSVEEADDCYKVTLAGGEVVYIPTEASLGSDITRSFFYAVDGDWASAAVNINDGANSWFADLKASYDTMDDAKAQLVARHLTVVADKEERAVRVIVDSLDVPENVTEGAGFVSGVEKTDDENIVKITITKVGKNGAVSHATYEIDLALTASYNFDAEFVKSLAKLAVDPAKGAFASTDQLIFAQVKSDGFGNFVLVKADDADINFTETDIESVFGGETLMNSVIYDIMGKVVRSSTKEALRMTIADTEAGGVKVVTTYAKYVVKGYKYEAVRDADGNVTGYVLTASSVEYVQKKVTNDLSGAQIDWKATYEYSDVYYVDKEGVSHRAYADSPATSTEDILDASRNIIDPDVLTFKDISDYQWRKYWLIDIHGNYILDINGNKQIDVTKGYFCYYRDAGSDKGIPTDLEVPRYIIDENGLVYNIEGFKGSHTKYITDEDGYIITGAPTIVDYGKGDTYTCEKNDDGKFVDKDGNVFEVNASTVFNATIASGKFNVTVAGKKKVYNVSDYTVYFITPCKDSENFTFSVKTVAEATGAFSIVSFAIDSEAKTITIFGE